ncbi:MAG: hypothetical protein RLY85_1483, partial [Bacteroidota bacterium]
MFKIRSLICSVMLLGTINSTAQDSAKWVDSVMKSL